MERLFANSDRERNTLPAGFTSLEPSQTPEERVASAEERPLPTRAT